jgi:hypothetical protein
MTGGQTVDDAELVVACTLDKAGLDKQSRRWRELHGRAEVRQLTPSGNAIRATATRLRTAASTETRIGSKRSVAQS